MGPARRFVSSRSQPELVNGQNKKPGVCRIPPDVAGCLRSIAAPPKRRRESLSTLNWEPSSRCARHAPTHWSLCLGCAQGSVKRITSAWQYRTNYLDCSSKGGIRKSFGPLLIGLPARFLLNCHCLVCPISPTPVIESRHNEVGSSPNFAHVVHGF
jgi:hypothetical protein